MRGGTVRNEYLAATVGAIVGWLAADAINKTPGVRAFDVAILGPFMVIASLETSLTGFQRCALAFAGGATMTYNLKNYLGNLQDEGLVSRG
jgi:hypothetical protein